MDELQQVTEDLANLELQAKEIIRQMAKNLCVDLTVAEECEPKQLVSPTDLQRRWMITNSEYEELLAVGLPTIQFASGVVRHPEVAVDEFFRMQIIQTRNEHSQKLLSERIVAAIEQVADRLPNLAGPPMTVEQVAEFASVSEKTIYRWVNQGRLKPKADGARPLLFERSEIEKALSSRLRT
jgi:excisionase family DNA binding protein